jgi:L-iditol 2-dehydrogenase
MRKMVLTGIRQMEMTESPMPQIARPDQVLLKIETVGVCGSDIHYYRTGKIGSQVVQYPYPVGHECAATVVEVGSGVTRFKPGDRVSVDPAIWCNDCDQCAKGRFHTCRNLLFMGCPGQIGGCLCDFYVMPEASCFKIRVTTSFELGALIEPLAIGVYAVQQSGIGPDSTITIQGLGPIGLSVLCAARAKGVSKIYVTEPLEYRRSAALQNGAVFGIDPYEKDANHEFSALVPDKMDVVFECCGKQEALDEACNLLSPGGTVMVVGIPEEDRLSFSPDIARRNELRFQNVRRQNECVEEAIALVENAEVDVSFMITHRYTFDQCKEAFDLVDGYSDGVIKAMIRL